MIRTNWGYTLTNVNEFTDFLTVEDFNKFTNGKFAGDQRISQNIPSATRSIQNYCGWHIVYALTDLRDAFVGPDLLIQLPARFVTDIKSVIVDAVKVGDEWQGEAITDFDLDESGLLRIFDIGYHDRRSRIRIVYDAGIDSTQMDVLKELVAHRVTHAVSSSYGITSEAAGGVSVTYNAAWAGNTRSTALPDDNKEILEAYKVKGVF